MPKQATAHIDDAELKMRDLAPPEEMERRREFVAWLRAQMDKPATKEDLEIWREFEADLKRDRPKFR
ncbi:MAG: hypothetical protein ACJ76Y_30840 [Thermoanaerobaculia bacterium]